MMEFDTYKAVYCGLCKQLGKAYGPFARMTLNYDFTFLSLLILGVKDPCPVFQRERCAANPLKRKACLSACDESLFAASVAMIMLYYKLLDNYRDSGFWGKLRSLLLLPWASHARKKAKKRYPEMERIIGEEMAKQQSVENDSSISPDCAAEPSARALAEIMALIPTTENDRRVLYRIGYLVGRWVYLIDALDDMAEDCRRRRFNPYLVKHHLSRQGGALPDFTRAKEDAIGAIRLTAGELGNTYELLDLKRYKPILDNIIYLGLPNTLDQILTGKTKQQRKKEDALEGK